VTSFLFNLLSYH